MFSIHLLLPLDRLLLQLLDHFVFLLDPSQRLDLGDGLLRRDILLLSAGAENMDMLDRLFLLFKDLFASLM